MSTLVDLADMIEKPEGVHKINTKLFSISFPQLCCLQELALESTNYDYSSAEYRVISIILDIANFRLFRPVRSEVTNCAPLLADLFLYSYENEFLDNMIRSGYRRLARSFNLCYRYIDDLIVFNNKKFLDYLREIYPSQLTVEKANKSDHLADYLDLTFIIDSGGKLSTRLYDKHDDFDFHIANFPFLSSNIPSGPSYGVYIL